MARKAEARDTPRAALAWSRWLGQLPTLERSSAWPFPVSVDRLGMVRNVAPPPAPAKPKATRGKAPGETVKLHVIEGDVPPAGVVLQLATGRRYKVLARIHKRIYCLVLAPDEDTGDAPVWPWRWASRRGKLQRAAA